MGLFSQYQEAVESARSFCDSYISEPQIQQWIISRGIPSSVQEAFFQSDLGRYCFPGNFGGKKCCFAERASVIAVLMRHAGATLPFLSDMLSMALLSTMPEQSQEEIITDFIARTGRISFSEAFSENGAGSDAMAVQTVVTTDNNEIYLDGEKSFVSGGEFASDVLVLARDLVFGQEDGGYSLWLVPASLPGIYTYPIKTVGQEMLANARLEFKHVPLDPNWKIQTKGNLNKMMKRQYELGRILICASSIGLARAAMDDALAHCSTYMTRGQLLGTFPQIQEKLTDMEIRLRSMEGLVIDAANEADKEEGHSFLPCSLMKRYVPKAATEVASEAMQIFGGLGYTDDLRVSRIWRDCRGNQIAQGSDEIMVRQSAKLLISEYIDKAHV